MNRGGDWTTQTEQPWVLFQALGADAVRQMADAGDRDAQLSLGYMMHLQATGPEGEGAVEADAAAGVLGTASTSPDADVLVGWELCTDTRRRCVLMWSPANVPTKIGVRCHPLAEEGMALLEKAAGQGQVYAMFKLGDVHARRQEHEQSLGWITKAAEAGLPPAMHYLLLPS